MGTYSSVILTGIKLTNTSQNPVTITSSAYIGDNGALTGVSGRNVAFNVSNFGQIVTTSTFANHEKANGHSGISLYAGGSVYNGASGRINVTAIGVRMAGVSSVGTLTNLGTIQGNNPLGGVYSVSAPDGVGAGFAAGTIVNGAGVGSTALIEGNGNGIDIGGSAATSRIKNFGSIIAAANTNTPGYYGAGGSADGRGIAASYNTTIVNYAGGLIAGHLTGVVSSGGGSVFNSGTITASLAGTAPGGTGISFANGGYASNSSTGLISGVNFGIASYNSVYGASGGTAINFGTIRATGTSGVGISLQVGGATVTNAGTISGAGGAVNFTGGGTNRLVVDPGAVFQGTVSATGVTTMELASAASAGKVNSLGFQYVNFKYLAFDSGARWTAEGSAVGIPGTITGFAAGDTIDVDGFLAATDTYTASGLVLTDLLSNHVTLGIQGNFSTGQFTILPDGNGGTDVTTTACFCRGTLILTPAGEVAVEELAIGDEVVTVAGEAKPIRWIGRRIVAARFADPLQALPVRIKAGALDDGVPCRDLDLSPDHALLVDGALIQAGALVNGRSIVRQMTVPETFTYYHIELADHDLIWVENTPSETFVDNVDRMGFDNWDEHQALYGDTDIIVEMAYPRAKAHRQVPMATRARLAARAARRYPASEAA